MAPTTSTTSLVHPLTTGEAEPVLVVEFQAWTAAPRLSRLLAERAEGHPVYQVDPVGALSGDQTYVSLDDLAVRSVEEFLAFDPPGGRVFIAGHCSASALTLHIAELLERNREVTAVLVGPSWPDEENVQHRFAEALSSFRVPARDCPALDRDPVAAVGDMADVLQQELDALAARSGVSAASSAFTELLTWHRGWLAFLLACHHAPTTQWGTTSTEVLVLSRSASGDHVPGMPRAEYAVCPAPVLHEQDPITPELAAVVLAQINARVTDVLTPQ